MVDDRLKWESQYPKNNQSRLDFIVTWVESTHDAGPILEAGCAPCHLLRLMHSRGFDCVGVDVAPERFQAYIETHDLDVEPADLERDVLPFEDNAFGTIVFSEVLEHLRINPLHAMRELRRVLHPKGRLLLTTPNLYSLGHMIRIVRGQGINDVVNEFEKLNRLGHMGHIREYAPYQVQSMLEATGFETLAVRYANFGSLDGKRPAIRYLRRSIETVAPWTKTYQIHIVTDGG